VSRLLDWICAKPWRLVTLFGLLTLPIAECCWYMAKH
jgi:hypothetical protein